MSKPEPKPYLSISQLDMLSKCGEQYRRRYIEHEIIPPAVAMLVGRGVDKSVDANLTHKVHNQELLPLEHIEALARDQISHEWAASNIQFSEEEIEKGIAEVKGEATDKTVRLASLHSLERAPHINPESEENIQRRWRIELLGFPRDLVGIIDVFEPEGALNFSEDGKLVDPLPVVRDTKTAAKTPPKAIIQHSQQLTAYALAMRVAGYPTPKVALDFLVDTKTPKTVVMEGERTQEDFNALLHRVENAIEVIEKGAFVPARPGLDWFCNEKWCGFALTCPYFVKKPKLVSLST